MKLHLQVGFVASCNGMHCHVLSCGIAMTNNRAFIFDVLGYFDFDVYSVRIRLIYKNQININKIISVSKCLAVSGKSSARTRNLRMGR